MTRHNLIIPALAAIASATVAVGLAAAANAAPVGPCADVPSIGVCVPASQQPSPPPQQSPAKRCSPPDTSSGMHFVN